MKYMLKNKIKNLLDIYKSRGYDGEIKYEKYLDVLSLSTEEIELIKSKWHSKRQKIGMQKTLPYASLANKRRQQSGLRNLEIAFQN